MPEDPRDVLPPGDEDVLDHLSYTDLNYIERVIDEDLDRIRQKVDEFYSQPDGLLFAHDDQYKERLDKFLNSVHEFRRVHRIHFKVCRLLRQQEPF